eukprot:330528-Prymnesium_polylepis.1
MVGAGGVRTREAARAAGAGCLKTSSLRRSRWRCRLHVRRRRELAPSPFLVGRRPPCALTRRRCRAPSRAAASLSAPQIRPSPTATRSTPTSWCANCSGCSTRARPTSRRC